VSTLSVRVVVRVRGEVTEESSAEANWRRHTDDECAVCVGEMAGGCFVSVQPGKGVCGGGVFSVDRMGARTPRVVSKEGGSAERGLD
jgi:hypothetical protein